MIIPMKKIQAIVIFLLITSYISPVCAGDNTPNLIWTDAVNILLKNNPESQAAKYTLDASRSQLRYSKGSLFPQISASGSYDTLGRSIYDQSYSYSLSASQPLFSHL